MKHKISKTLDFIGIISEFGLYAFVITTDFILFKEAYTLGILETVIYVTLTPILAGVMLWERIRKWTIK